MTIQDRIDEAKRNSELSRCAATGEPTNGAYLEAERAAQLTRVLALVQAAEPFADREAGHTPEERFAIIDAIEDMRDHGDIHKAQISEDVLLQFPNEHWTALLARGAVQGGITGIHITDYPGAKP